MKDTINPNLTFKILFYVCCLCVFLCSTSVPGACASQKRLSDARKCEQLCGCWEWSPRQRQQVLFSRQGAISSSSDSFKGFERKRASENQACLIRTLNCRIVKNDYRRCNVGPQTVSVASVWQKCLCVLPRVHQTGSMQVWGLLNETWLRGQCSSVLCCEEDCYRGRVMSAFHVLSWLGPWYLSYTLGNIPIR